MTASPIPNVTYTRGGPGKASASSAPGTDWLAPQRPTLSGGYTQQMLLGVGGDQFSGNGGGNVTNVNNYYAGLEAQVGRMGLRRAYCNSHGIPTSMLLSPSAPDIGMRTSWLSISNTNPNTMISGAWDAAVRAFAISVGSHPMMLTYNHEPEDDGYSAALFVAAYNRFYDVAKAANPLIQIGPVYMDFTFDPTQPRGPVASWLPTASRCDFFGIDTYQIYKFANNEAYTTWWDVPLTRWSAYFATIDSLSATKGSRIPAAIGELGCANWHETGVSGHPPDNGTASPVGTRKAGFIRDALNYFETRGCMAISYFNTDVNNDYALSSFIEADAPSRAVWSSFTSTHTGWPT